MRRDSDVFFVSDLVQLGAPADPGSCGVWPLELHCSVTTGGSTIEDGFLIL